MVTGNEVPSSGSAPRAPRAAVTRRWLALGGAVAGATTLAACGAPGGGADGGIYGGGYGATGGTTGGNTKSFRLLMQVRTTAGYEDLVKWGISEYKKKYPNATIDTMLEAGNVEKTLAPMVAGEGPDIMHAWGHVMWQFAAKGQLFNHNDLIRDWKQAEIQDFADFQWKGFVIPTTNFRFGMPLYINMMVLYYNKSLFAKRGQKEPTVDWNLDDYAAAAKQLTFQDGAQKVWGAFMPTGFDRFQNKVLNFGGHVVDPKDLTKTQLDQGPAQQGMQWIHDRLWKDQTFAPIDSNKRTWQPTSQWDGFYQGQIAMLEDGMHNFAAAAINMTGAEWNIAHVPKGPASGGGRRAVLGTTDGWGLWKGTKNKDAAWDLMKLITGKEWYEQQSKLTGLIPSRKSALNAWVEALRGKHQALAKVDMKVVTDALTTMNYPTVDEIFVCQTDVASVIGPALNAVFRDNEKPVSYFRDIKGEVETAAARCGIKPSEVYK